MFQRMLPYPFKYVGWTLILLSSFPAISLFIFFKSAPVFWLAHPSLKSVFIIIGSLGFLVRLYSKEPDEDERTILIRIRCMAACMTWVLIGPVIYLILQLVLADSFEQSGISPEFFPTALVYGYFYFRYFKRKLKDEE